MLLIGSMLGGLLPTVQAQSATNDPGALVLSTGDSKLHLNVPLTGRAYDSLTIPYTLEGGGSPRVAIEANSFERTHAQSYYNSYVPGVMTASIAYEGSAESGKLGEPVKTEKVKSSRINKGYIRHYITVTNTGDTIWMSQGLGMVSLRMQIIKASGEMVDDGNEHMQMFTKDFYPGETRPFTFLQYDSYSGGDYKFRYVLSRHNDEAGNIFDRGEDFAYLDVPITIGGAMSKESEDAKLVVGGGKSEEANWHADNHNVIAQIDAASDAIEYAVYEAGQTSASFALDAGSSDGEFREGQQGEGDDARSVISSTSSSEEGYLYFNLADDSVSSAASKRSFLDIVYYDEGTGAFSVQYDAGNNEHFRGSFDYARTNTRTWRTARFELPGAVLQNGTNGNDFRLVSKQGQPLFVNRIAYGAYNGSVAPNSPPGGDGFVNVTEAGGTSALTSAIMPGDGVSYQAYDIDDGLLASADWSKGLYAEVDYYDSGTEFFFIQYDGTNGGYTDTRDVRRQHTQQWKTAVFEIKHPRLMNGQNGSDFRIVVKGGQLLSIKAIRFVQYDNGIKPHTPEGGDGPVARTDVGGRSAFTAALSGDTTYMSFDVDNSIAIDSEKNYYLDITYFDEGNHSFYVNYESETNAYETTESIETEATNQWRTATFRLNRVKFANGQSENDFRMTSTGGLPLKVSAIAFGEFSGQDDEDGLEAYSHDEFYGPVNYVTKAGSQAYTAKVVSQNHPYQYMSFVIADESLINQKATYYIDVEYYDEGTNNFQIHYDGVQGDGTVNHWMPTDNVARTGTNTWRKATFLLPDAQFVHGAYGEDFRIASHIDPVHIRSITLGKATVLTSSQWNGGESMHNEPVATYPEVLTDMRQFMQHVQVLNAPGTVSGELQVQLPPWDAPITLKLVTDEGIAVAQVQVKVTTNHLKIDLSKSNATWKARDGVGLSPVMSTWYYPYRAARFGENPEQAIENDLRQMKAAGIQAVWIQLFPHFIAYDNLATLTAMRKAKEIGIKVIPSLYFWNGRSLLQDQTGIPLQSAGSGEASSMIDPLDLNFGTALSDWYDRVYADWGDVFYRTTDGKVPVVLSEETGLGVWTRRLGGFTTQDIEAFRQWLIVKYGSLQAVNDKWGTTYADLDEINPQFNMTAQIDYPDKWKEGTNALLDLDLFRTEISVKQTADASMKIKAKHPEVITGIHVFPVYGMENSGLENRDSPSVRNIIAERTAAMAEYVLDPKISHLDFITQTNTPGETDWGKVSKATSAKGMTAVLYPEFNSTKYVTGKGLGPIFSGSWSAGYMEMAGVVAREYRQLYPVVPGLIGMVENGGIAGIYSWNDHPLFSTMGEVQLKELAFYRSLVEGAKAVKPTDNSGGTTTSPGGGSSGTSDSTLSIGDDGKATVSFRNLPLSAGTARAHLGAELLTRAQRMARPDAKGIKRIDILLDKQSGAEGYALTLPTSQLKDDGSSVYRIKTPIGTVSVQSDMLAGSVVAGDEVTLILKVQSTDKLPLSVRNANGNRPVLDIELQAGGKPVAWKNARLLTVSIPYTLSGKEIRNSHKLAIFQVADDGTIQPIYSGRYVADEAVLRFKTDHLSRFAVIYVDTTFNDLDGYEWARPAIEALASKSILRGLTAERFNPQAHIHRGDFALMLAKALQLRESSNGSPQIFVDVKPGDYRYEAVQTLYSLGIAKGVSSSVFDTKAPVTRQDIMTMIARAAEIAGLPLPRSQDEEELLPFSDSDQVSEYARVAVATLIGNGIIEGSGNQLSPLKPATRAEAAVIINRIYNLHS